MHRLAALLCATVVGLLSCGSAAGATPAAFVPLGIGPFVRPAPAELGTPAVEQLAAVVAPAGRAEADAALRAAVPAGSRAFAFLLTGCRETGAVLHVDGVTLWAEPTGGEGVNCSAAEHVLVTFEVPAGSIPRDVRLSNMRGQ